MILLYLVPIGFVANYAQKKGRNWYVFALLGLILSWVIALVVALLVEDKRSRATPPADDRVRRLTDLAALRESGALTESEFQAEKARILQEEF